MFFLKNNFVSSKVCLRLIWWFLGVYRVHGTTKEEFVANVIQVEMQHYHLYIARHAIRVTNVTIAYRVKHKIVDNDMV
jgi:hypothetical protein